jgi:hypothetical protein
MLTGQELGDAIAKALEQNGRTQADAARFFNVKPPSVSGWVKTGRISKDNFDRLRAWLRFTPDSHWGAASSPLEVRDTVAPYLAFTENVSVGAAVPLIQALTEALARLDAAQRERVAEKLQALARYPDSAIAQTELAQAMGQAAPTVATVPAPESKDFQPPVPPSLFAKTKQPL